MPPEPVSTPCTTLPSPFQNRALPRCASTNAASAPALGDYWETGFFDHVTDAGAALGFLKAQPEVRPEKVFLLGHSEGALIATRLAGTGAQVAGVILLAGPAQTGEQVLIWQSAQVLKGMHGFNKWLIDLFHIDARKAQQKQLDKLKRSHEGCGSASSWLPN